MCPTGGAVFGRFGSSLELGHDEFLDDEVDCCDVATSGGRRTVGRLSKAAGRRGAVLVRTVAEETSPNG